MADRLDGAREKVRRAQAHLYEIEVTINAFFNTAYESTVFEDDPETGEKFFVLHELRRPDPSVALLIGDFLNNARSALDHTAFQLVKHPIAPGGRRCPDNRIAFPICDDPAIFESSKGRIRGTAPGVEAVVESLQPYPQRTSPVTFQPSYLALLRDLNDWDKHRLIHVVESRFGGAGFLNYEFIETWSAHDPGPLKAPAELARYKTRPGVDPNVDVGFNLTSEVAFEDGPAKGWGVPILLARIRYEVSQIIERLAPLVAAP
jgi:hypothetical protein